MTAPLDPPREHFKVRSLRDELGFLLDSTVDLPATAYDRDTLLMRLEASFLAREKSPPPSVSDASRASRLVERWINRGVDWPATFDDVAKMKGELATAFNDASDDARRTISELAAERDAARRDKDGAYAERNMIVGALSKLFSAWLGNDPKEPDWPVVYVELPTGQASWHITQRERYSIFAHLNEGGAGCVWDGHDDVEKYRRVCTIDRAEAAEAEPRRHESADHWEGPQP